MVPSGRGLPPSPSLRRNVPRGAVELLPFLALLLPQLLTDGKWVLVNQLTDGRWSRSCICPCFSSPQAVSSFKEAGHSLSLVMSLLFGFQSAPVRCSRNKMAQPEVGMQSVVGTATLSHRPELSQKR